MLKGVTNIRENGTEAGGAPAPVEDVFNEAETLVGRLTAAINEVVTKLDSIIPRFGFISSLSKHENMARAICLIYLAAIGKSTAGAFQALDGLREQIANTKTIAALQKAMAAARSSIEKIVSTNKQRDLHVDAVQPVETLIGGVWRSFTGISPKDLSDLESEDGTLKSLVDERRRLIAFPTTENVEGQLDQNAHDIIEYLQKKDQHFVEELKQGIDQHLPVMTRSVLTENLSLRERTFAKMDGKQEAIESIVQTRVKGFSGCNEHRIRTGWQVLENPNLKIDFSHAQEDVLVATILCDTGIFYQSQQGVAPGKAFRKALKKTLCGIIDGKMPLQTCIDQVCSLFPFDDEKDMAKYTANIRRDIQHLKAHGRPAPLPVLDILTDFYGHPEKQKEWMIRYGHLHCLHSGFQGIVVMKDAEICSYYGDPSGFNKSVRELRESNFKKLEPSPPFATIFMMQTLALQPEKIPALVSGEQLLKRSDSDSNLGEHQTQLNAREKALIGEEVLSLLQDGRRLLQASAEKSQTLYRALQDCALRLAENGEVSGGVLEMHMQHALGPILSKMLKTAPVNIDTRNAASLTLEHDLQSGKSALSSTPDSVISPLAAMCHSSSSSTVSMP